MSKNPRWTNELVRRAAAQARVRLHQIAEMDRESLLHAAHATLGISSPTIPSSTLRRYLIDAALDAEFSNPPTNSRSVLCDRTQLAPRNLNEQPNP